MDYEDFELQLGPPVNGGYLVRVLQSPAGQGEAVLCLPEAVEHNAVRDLQTRIDRKTPSPQAGSLLFQSLFKGPIGSLFLQSLSLTGAQRGLRIRLRINPRGEGLEILHQQPWELLYREETDDYLALSRRTPVVRALDIARPVPTGSFDPPLRILVVASQGPGMDLLNLGEELKQLQGILNRNSGVVLEVLENPRARTLREALEKAPFHVLHYMGHGTFDPATGEGALLLESSDGRQELLSGRHLATKIKDVSSLRLVVLNACKTALASGSPANNPFAGVAAALLLGGVPAVVAMQANIADQHAIAFSKAFYQQLARGAPVDEAVVEGRHAIYSLCPSGNDWSIPVLFLRTPTGELFTRSQPDRRSATSRIAKAAGVTMAAALLVSALVPLHRSAPQITEMPRTSGQKTEPSPHETISKEEKKPPSTPDHSPEPYPKAGRAVPTAQTGSANSGLRVLVTGSRLFPSTFNAALRRELRRYSTESLAGWTLRLDAEPPEVTSFAEEDEVMKSCRLSVSAQLDGQGQTFDLGPMGDSYAGFNKSVCDSAAAELAGHVARKITPYLGKEGSL